MNQNQERRRGQSHRPRRGSDRGPDRRPPPQQPQDRSGRGQVDVEQIMRDIRARIAQRQGIDLSNQQIQDLASRRLESILDPRAIKPSLLDGLRRSAAATPAVGPEKIPNEPTFSFEDTTLYDSHRGSLRFVRRLLNPLLKLFFNPNPLIRALHLQARLNVEAAERNAERDRRQTEWNALHYEIVQRLVTEVSRASLELQALSLRVESLAARVDFNDRRVGSLEGSTQRPRPQGRPPEPPAAGPVVESDGAPATPAPTAADGQTPEGRRRRRRRRGRRSGAAPGEFQVSPSPEGSWTGASPPISAEAPAAPSEAFGQAEEDDATVSAPETVMATQPEPRDLPPSPAATPVTAEPTGPELPSSPTDSNRSEY